MCGLMQRHPAGQLVAESGVSTAHTHQTPASLTPTGLREATSHNNIKQDTRHHLADLRRRKNYRHIVPVTVYKIGPLIQKLDYSSKCYKHHHSLNQSGGYQIRLHVSIFSTGTPISIEKHQHHINLRDGFCCILGFGPEGQTADPSGS